MTIQRAIARDILVVFVVSLSALTFMVLIIGVAREAISQGLSVIGVLRLIPYAVPDALTLAVPATALFSICSVYGRMSADNEFTAMQSVGVSPVRAMLPAIVIASLLSLGTVFLVNIAFTWGFHGIQHVVMSSVENIAYDVLKNERNFQHGPLSLTVRDVSGRDLIEPNIKIRRANGESVSIVARKAVLAYNDAEEELKLSITNGAANLGDKGAFYFPDTFEQTIPLSTKLPYSLLTANPSHMPMRDLPRASIRQRSDIRQREGEVAVRTGFSILTSHCSEIADSVAQGHESALHASRKRLHRLAVEMHRRWASGFTCLALAMVAIPLAIRMKSADTMTTFGIVFLPTLLVYYPIFVLTVDMAKDGRIAACGVWIANGLFIAISIVMMQKTTYSPS